MDHKTGYQATNIRLPRETLEQLKLKGVKERKSLACLIREAIAVAYRIGAAQEEIDPKKDPFYKLIGSCDSGIPDGAERHDRDIYGAQ